MQQIPARPPPASAPRRRHAPLYRLWPRRRQLAQSCEPIGQRRLSDANEAAARDSCQKATWGGLRGMTKPQICRFCRGVTRQTGACRFHLVFFFFWLLFQVLKRKNYFLKSPSLANRTLQFVKCIFVESK